MLFLKETKIIIIFIIIIIIIIINNFRLFSVKLIDKTFTLK
jgi:hypothetical protein